MAHLLHQSFLIRLWRQHERAPVRATVIDVAEPEQRRHFGSLDELFAFLQSHAEPPDDGADGAGDPKR